MSLVWQKQLLLEDYRGVRGGKEEKIHRWNDKATQGRKKNQRKWNRTRHMSVCKPVNLMTRTAGKSLRGILTSPFPSPPPRGSQDREANQFVNIDGAKATINKVSVLFTFCPENHLGDRRVLFLSLKGIPTKQQFNNMQLLLQTGKFDMIIKLQI